MGAALHYLPKFCSKQLFPGLDTNFDLENFTFLQRLLTLVSATYALMYWVPYIPSKLSDFFCSLTEACVRFSYESPATDMQRRCSHLSRVLSDDYQARASPKGERAAWYSYAAAWFPLYFLKSVWTNQVRTCWKIISRSERTSSL